MANEHDYFTVPADPGQKVAAVDSLGTCLPDIKQQLALESGARMPDGLLAKKTLKPGKGGAQYWDFLYSIDQVIVASRRACEFLSAQGLTAEEVQFLSVGVKDKKGKKRPEDYAIVNPLRKIACLDPESSDANYWTNPRTGKSKWKISILSVDKRKIPEEAKLFRLEEDSTFQIIRGDLLRAIEAAGLKGLVGLEMGRHPLGLTAAQMKAGREAEASSS